MSDREYEAYQLFVLAEAGAERVRLCMGATPTHACRETHGAEFSIDDAMRLAPIPHQVAPNRRCRCTYRPVTGPYVS